MILVQAFLGQAVSAVVVIHTVKHLELLNGGLQSADYCRGANQTGAIVGASGFKRFPTCNT